MVSSLERDCAHCAALCCVLLDFEASEDFAHTKPAGTPCMHLNTSFQCRIHSRLPVLGYAGCVSFDCHGAGQRVTARLGGASWARGDRALQETATVFALFQQVHTWLKALQGAAQRPGVPLEAQGRAHALMAVLDAELEAPLAALATLDTAPLEAQVKSVLQACLGAAQAGPTRRG